MYSVLISVLPEDLVGQDNLFDPKQIKKIFEQPDIRVNFESKEEKDEYLKLEYIATAKQMRKYAAAWSKDDRVRAKVEVYAARRAFYFSMAETHAKEQQTA